jgi:tRNA 2-selenouridine synthase
MELPQTDNYHDLLVNDVPLIDVRAPIEFDQGSFPGAQNLPLMNDEERHKIGIRYKEAGQEKAIELGHELVTEGIKYQRVTNWCEFAENNPHGALYCFRGGLRSRISQQWLYEATGIMYPRVSGGYKALRRYLIDELEQSITKIQPLILGGRTGTGKTLLIKELEYQIDLEGIFNHRGSAFGKYATPQPSQIDIENSLSIEFLKHRQKNHFKLVLEDEAPNIGSRQLPRTLYETMRTSPLVILEADTDERIQNIFSEYITDSLKQYRLILGESSGFDAWEASLTAALEKIQRRLGGVRFKQLKDTMQQAFMQQRKTGNTDRHREWIRFLLINYYDPMYDYQLSKKSDRIIFRGNFTSILEYFRDQHNVS